MKTKEVPKYENLLEKLTIQMVRVGLVNTNNTCKHKEPIFYCCGYAVTQQL